MALCPLIDFAKEVLAGKEENWHNYPIFLKATGGMRELPFETREKIMNAVRAYLSDSSSLPFAFSHDNARVISGEEEGAYGWAAVNFLKGNLVQESQGSGTVDAGFTVGTLDLGGASTQISFFKPDQDIVANLFKLQLGGQKHWNIYTHSFPHCGQNSARSRMQARLAGGPAMLVASTAPGQGVPDYGVRIEAEGSLASQGLGEKVAGAETGAEVWTGAGVRGKALAESMEAAGASGVEQNRRPMGVGPERLSGLLEVRDACLPLGYNETVTPPGGEGMLLMVPEAGGSNLSACMVQTHALLELHMNTWCEFSHSDQCSIMGTYQPDLPTGNDHGQFYAFAGYYYMWKFLQLPSRTVSIADIETAGRKVCAMSMSELEELNSQLDPATALDNVEHLPHYCFLTSYALSLLRDGYRFPEGAEITFVQEVAGYKVDWALGSMLYEINALPWQYIGPESNHGVNTTLDPGGNEHIAPGGCNGSADGVAVSDTAKTLRAGDASGDNDDVLPRVGGGGVAGGNTVLRVWMGFLGGVLCTVGIFLLAKGSGKWLRAEPDTQRREGRPALVYRYSGPGIGGTCRRTWIERWNWWRSTWGKSSAATAINHGNGGGQGSKRGSGQGGSGNSGQGHSPEGRRLSYKSISDLVEGET